MAAVYAAPAAEEAEPAAVQDAPVAEDRSEDEAGESAAEEEKELTPEETLTVLRRKMEDINKAYAELTKPSRNITSMYTKLVEEAKERTGKMEDLKRQMEELTAQLNAESEEYVFSVVPEDERFSYETEGNAMVKKVIAALSSKSETAQIEGLQNYEVVRDTYQGIPDFAQAYTLYQNVVAKYEKKWNSQLESIKRERQKWSSSRADQTNEGEQRQYDKLAAKMASEHRNIDDDWFLPKSGNALMLEQALTRARRAKSASQNKILSKDADIPTMLHQAWDDLEGARALLNENKLDEASNKMSEDESLRELMNAGRLLMPENVREGIRKQAEEMRTEIRKRKTDRQKMERDRVRANSSFARENTILGTRMTSMADMIETAKEAELRRAEEAAAREAELKEEQERLAAEAAEEAEEEKAENAEKEDEPVQKKPKKKKKKKAE